MWGKGGKGREGEGRWEIFARSKRGMGALQFVFSTFYRGQAVQRFLHLSRIAFWPATQA